MVSREKRANFLFLITGISLLVLCAFLFMRVIYLRGVQDEYIARLRAQQNAPAVPAPQEAPRADNTPALDSIQIDDSRLSDIFNRAIPTDLPLRDMTVAIGEGGACDFSFCANVPKLIQLASPSDLGLLGAAAKLMPEEVLLQGSFVLLTDAEGNVNILPQRIHYENTDIPLSVIPDTVFAALSERVSDLLRQSSGAPIANLRFEKGRMTVESLKA